MDFMSCLFVILGKKDNKDDSINKHVEEAAVRKKVTIKPETPEASYGPIYIYFGSQTGTAASYAKILGEEAAKNGFKPKLIDLIDFDPEYLQSLKLTVFIMATHGEGEPTDNSVAFNEWLSDKERTGEELKGQKFTVFGLGNKQYQFYNAQGRKTNQGLEKLGGERVYKYGEGDDDGSLEDDFNEWKTDLWEELKKVVDVSFVTSGTQPNENKHALPFVLTITKEKEIDFEQYDHTKDQKNYEFQMKQYLTSASAQITGMRELRQKTDDGSSLNIEIDCGSVGVSYTTASNMSLFPENCPNLVEKATKLLKLDPETVFTIKENKDMDKGIKFKYPFPTPLSVRTYLTKFCDLMGPIRKKQLKELAEFCPKNRDKEKLLFLASNNGKVEFEAQVQSSMLGLLDILEMYEINIDLENLIQIASLIQPRYYTIASSSKKNPNTIRLCCTVHGDTLPNGTRRIGATSAFFTELHHRLKKGLPIPRVKIAVKESTFRLPTDNKLPVYMVGPGAGLAPFKGFIEEKEFLIKEGKENPFGEMTLYFGCRGRNWDYLYKEELRKYHDEGVIDHLHVAFSREKAEKTYVQNLIEQNRDVICRDFFERGATVYICGAMGMGKSVVKKLVEFAAFHYKIEMTEATKKVEDMEKNKRIIKWHYKDPAGKIQGSFSMVQLRKWSNTGYFPADLKIWKSTDKQEESILLTDALAGRFEKAPSAVDNILSTTLLQNQNGERPQVDQNVGSHNSRRLVPTGGGMTSSGDVSALSTERWSNNDSSNLPSPTPKQNTAGWVGGDGPSVTVANSYSSGNKVLQSPPALPDDGINTSSVQNFGGHSVRGSENNYVNSGSDFGSVPTSEQVIAVQSGYSLQNAQSFAASEQQTALLNRQPGAQHTALPSQSLNMQNPVLAPGQLQGHGNWGTTPSPVQSLAGNFPNAGGSVLPQSDYWSAPAQGSQQNIQHTTVPTVPWGAGLQENMSSASAVRPENNTGWGMVPGNPNVGWGGPVPPVMNVNWGAAVQAMPPGNVNPGWAPTGPLPGNSNPGWVAPSGNSVGNANPGWVVPTGSVGSTIQGPTSGNGWPMMGTGNPGALAQGPPQGDSNQGRGTPTGSRGTRSNDHHQDGRFSGQRDKGSHGSNSGYNSRNWDRQSSFGNRGPGGSSRGGYRKNVPCPYNTNGRRCVKGSRCNYIHS